MLKTYFKMAISPSSCWEIGVGEVSLIFTVRTWWGSLGPS